MAGKILIAYLWLRSREKMSEAIDGTKLRKRIGELLVEAGIIRSHELPEGLDEARERSLRLGEVLVMLRYLSAEDLESVLLAQTRLSEGRVSENMAVEALKVASSHRLNFDKALEKLERESQEKPRELATLLGNYRKDLAQAEKLHGPANREIANISLKIGDALRQLGDHDEAEEYYKRALQIFERSFGQRNLKVANCLGKLADLYFYQNKLGQAETLYWRALEITQAAWGTDNLEAAQSQKALAGLLEAQGRFKEAEQFYLSSMRIIERIAGPDSPELTDNLRHLAGFWAKQGRRPERKRLGDLLLEAGLLQQDQLQQALQHVTRQGRPLGQALVRLNYMTEAELRPALQAQLLVADGVLPSLLAVRALRLTRQGRSLEDALQELGWEPDRFTTNELRLLIAAAEELMAAEVALGSDHAGVAILSMKLADVYVSHKKYVDAEPLYLRAISILEKAFGPEDAEVAGGLYKMAMLNTLTNKYAEAQNLLWRAVEIYRRAYGPEHADIAECLEALAALHEREHNHEQAEKLYVSALSIRENLHGRTSARTLATLTKLASIYDTQEKSTEAEATLLRLLRATEKECGAMHHDLASILEKLGELYFKRKDFAKGETQFELAIEILEQEPDDDEHLELLERYSALLEGAGKATESKKLKERARLLRQKS